MLYPTSDTNEIKVGFNLFTHVQEISPEKEEW